LNEFGWRCLTLEVLIPEAKSLEDVPKGQLYGKICMVIILLLCLPVEIGFIPILAPMILIIKADLLKLTAKTLLLTDRGFYHFSFFAQLITSKLTLLQGSKLGLRLKLWSSPINKLETNSLTGHRSTSNPHLRLVEIRIGKTWYSYITSV